MDTEMTHTKRFANRSPDVRYIAEWIVKQYIDELGEWMPDRDEYAGSAHQTLETAQRAARGGSESADGRITTWTGETLATIERTGQRYRSNFGDWRTPFWARGIDGRLYYGRHQGIGMYLRMRPSKAVQ